MFELLGDAPAAAKAEAQTVMEIETALAKASLTRVDQRDPYKLFHKMPRAKLAAHDAVFRLGRLLEGERREPTREWSMSPSRSSTRRWRSSSRRGTMADWKTYLRWHAAHNRAPYLSAPFVNANFDFYQQTSARREGTAAALEALRRLVDRDLGEALGQVFVAKTFTGEPRRRRWP